MLYDDLTNAERRVLEDILQAPSMWCLQIVAGRIGVDAALRACVTRELSEAVTEHLRDLQYGVQDLPIGEVARLLLPAVRIEAMLKVAKSKKPTLQTAARRTGVSLPDALKARRMLSRIRVRRPSCPRG